jgi:hypothetical protein
MRQFRAWLQDLELFESIDDESSQLLCLRRLAALAVGEQAGSRAVRVCRAGLQKADAPDQQAEFFGMIAGVLLRRNHDRAAAAAYGRAAELFLLAEKKERHWGARLAGAIATSISNPDRARDALLSLAQAIGAVCNRSKAGWLRQVMVTLGELDLREGRTAQARVCARGARALLRLEGIEEDGRLASLEGRAALRAGYMGEAEAKLTQAVDWFAEQGDSFGHVAALEGLGWLLLEAESPARARQLLAKAIEMVERLGDAARAVRIELLRASSFVEGNPAEATRYLLRAADRMAAMKRPPADLSDAVLDLAAMLPGSMLAEQLRERMKDAAV